MKRISNKVKSIVYTLVFSGIITLFTAMILGTAFTAPSYGHLNTMQGYILEHSATARQDDGPLHLIVTEHWKTQYTTMKIVNYDNPPEINAKIDFWAMVFWHKGTRNSFVKLYNSNPQILHVRVDQQYIYSFGDNYFVETLYVWMDCYPNGDYESGGGIY